jgi:hypothetical protein
MNKKYMRDKGFYWVRIYDEWTVAEWVGDRWFLCGNECEVFDNELKAIGSRIPAPSDRSALRYPREMTERRRNGKQ